MLESGCSVEGYNRGGSKLVIKQPVGPAGQTMPRRAVNAVRLHGVTDCHFEKLTIEPEGVWQNGVSIARIPDGGVGIHAILNNFELVTVDGRFTNAALFTRGAEVIDFEECIFRNWQDGQKSVFTTEFLVSNSTIGFDRCSFVSYGATGDCVFRIPAMTHDIWFTRSEVAVGGRLDSCFDVGSEGLDPSMNVLGHWVTDGGHWETYGCRVFLRLRGGTLLRDLEFSNFHPFYREQPFEGVSLMKQVDHLHGAFFAPESGNYRNFWVQRTPGA